MVELPYSEDNVELVQEFLNETKGRIANGIEITFTQKASLELEFLAVEYEITVDDIEQAILNLTPEHYYRGIDPSGRADFNVCAFRTSIGKDEISVYFKYGLEAKGLQILIFSNHIPVYPMNKPFKK